VDNQLRSTAAPDGRGGWPIAPSVSLPKRLRGAGMPSRTRRSRRVSSLQSCLASGAASGRIRAPGERASPALRSSPARVTVDRARPLSHHCRVIAVLRRSGRTGPGRRARLVSCGSRLRRATRPHRLRERRASRRHSRRVAAVALVRPGRTHVRAADHEPLPFSRPEGSLPR
jgi:hypothetical protein